MSHSTTTDTSSQEVFSTHLPSLPTLTLAHHPEEELVGRTLLLGAEPLELGRDSSAFGASTLNHKLLSRRHARFSLRGDSLVVQDLGSRNGVFVGGARVRETHAPLGSVIELGPFLFYYHLAPAAYSARASTRIVGKSAPVARLLDEIDRVAAHATTTLVIGETGTGKELVAREIHERSRRAGAFVAVNCGSLPDGVLHAELFGYERGAFSGAVASQKGLFEAAEAGTLLLDEIGDASRALQVSLLRVLQENEVRRLGSVRSIAVDTRILAATHRPLVDLIADGSFREDLYARLSRWVIRVPPLRERREDIPLLTRSVLGRLGERRRLHRSAVAALLMAAYPRNVRQLEAVLERIVRSASSSDNELRMTDGAAAALGEAATAGVRGATTSPPSSIPASGPRNAEEPGRPDADTLRRLMLEEGANVTHLARRLGIGRNTLYRWLREAGVALDALRGPGR